MRSKRRWFFMLLLLSLLPMPPTYAKAEEDDKKTFAIEQKDLEALQQKKMDGQQAVRFIWFLLLFPFFAYLLLLIFKALWYEPSAQSQNYQVKLKRTNNRGAGADIDPYRGIGNDPL